VTIVADRYRFITGVDTHSKKHQYAVIDHTGRLLDERSFPADRAGITRAATWIEKVTGGAEFLASVDGAGSYGRQLSVAFAGSKVRVVEAPKTRYRPAGKDDRLDARAAAAAVLPLDEEALNDVKAGAERDAIQILLTARAEMTRERTKAVNRLIALVRRFDLGVTVGRSLTVAQTRQIAAWTPDAQDPVDIATARAEATRLATRILTLHDDAAANKKALLGLTRQVAPQLLAQPGVGPISAAQVFASWSHPGRVRSDAAFGRLSGTAPKPASSGDRTRHRLDRGGDRRLNAALHRVIITRWRSHPETIAYVERRRAQGRTDRDIRRILKRYLARDLYRLLEAG
jgi:transposase